MGMCWRFVLPPWYNHLPFACLSVLSMLCHLQGRARGSTWHARLGALPVDMLNKCVQIRCSCVRGVWHVVGIPLHICMANDVPLRVWGLSM